MYSLSPLILVAVLFLNVFCSQGLKAKSKKVVLIFTSTGVVCVSIGFHQLNANVFLLGAIFMLTGSLYMAICFLSIWQKKREEKKLEQELLDQVNAVYKMLNKK